MERPRRPVTYEMLTRGLTMWRRRQSFLYDSIDEIDRMAATLALNPIEMLGLRAQRKFLLECLIVCNPVVDVLTRTHEMWIALSA